MGELLSVVPSKTDAEMAKELRAKAVEAYQPVMDLMEYAAKNNFAINATLGITITGKAIIQHLQIVRIYNE